MAAVVMISDVHGLHSRTSLHVVAQSVGTEAEAETVVICRVAVVVVAVVVAAAAAAALAVILLVKVAVVDMTTGTVAVLLTALEWLTRASKTPRVTKFLLTNTPAIKSFARLPQLDPDRGPATELVWRIWQVRVICFSNPTSNAFFLRL